MTRSPFVFAIALLLVSARPVVAADAATPGKTVRLLTVGNSFSHNATHYLGDLAKASGNALILKEANVGGATMELHWNKAQLHEKDPADKAGRYTEGRGLREWLQADQWDFVTIQQASIKSHDLATYRPFARELRDYIGKFAPGAEVMLHETWEYRSDDPRFAAKTPKPGEPATQDAMYQGLSSAYRTIAKELGVRLIPVGDAFHLADTDPKWGYRPDAKFDAKTARAPARPDQTNSLHVGWRWAGGKDGRQSLRMDGHHANAAGEYLGACVFYEVLFGASVVGNAFVPPGVDAAFARFLQETAHRAVVESRAAQ